MELILTITLLGIVAGVAAPRFFETTGFYERFFRDDVRAALTYAQGLAVASGCPVQVTINSSTYTLAQRASCSSGTWTQAVVHPTTRQSGYSGTAPSGVSFSSTVSPFRFDALGRARNASDAITDVTITIGARTLVTTGATGFTHPS